MTKPKVSVLMPVFDAEQYLSQAIESILYQSFIDWELIIINDGSSDGSKSIISQYSDKRIKYIENDKNLGLIKSLNKGIDYCSGKYIARMDADDFSIAERLQLQVDFLDTHPAHILCGTNAIVINNMGEKVGKIHNFTEDEYLKIHLLFSVPFVHPSMMIRRSVLVDNRYDEAYKHVEDYELWCRLSPLGKIANINAELLLYRWHEANVSVLNEEHQTRLKNEIIKQSLAQLGLQPNESELYCHKISFCQYALGIVAKKQLDSLSEVENWFVKLAKQNKIKGIYKQSSFLAFLWSRWLVLCFSQKEYAKIWCPQFASYSPKVIAKLLRLVLVLKQKR